MDQPDDAGSPLPRPRFSLRTLLLAVTAVSLLFGAIGWMSPLAIAGLVLAGLVIGAHVFGNAVGTQLRDRAPQRRVVSQEPCPGEASPAHDPAPVTHFGERWPLGWGLVILTTCGALAGVFGGCLLMEYAYNIGFDLNVLLVAGLAFGALGGFAAFALASFSQVTVVAILQALRHK